MPKLQKAKTGESLRMPAPGRPLNSPLLFACHQKCDCARPVCSQCTRFGRERDCEYSDKDHRSRTEILEERVAFLEARLRETEQSDKSTSPPTVRLNQQMSWESRAEEMEDILEHGNSSFNLGTNTSPGAS